VSRFLPKFLRSMMGARSSATTVVGINAEGAAWLEHSPTGLAHWRTLAWQDAVPSQALDRLRGQLGVTQLPGCQLVFAPSLLRHWLQTPPAQVASLRELRDVVQARCTQLFGAAPSTINTPAQWSVSAQWHANRPFVCTALSNAWTDALEAHAPKLPVSADLIARALAHYHSVIPSTGWLALVIAQSLYVLQLQARAVVSLRVVRLPLLADVTHILNAAKEEWTREMLRSNSSANTLFCLCVHPNAAPTVVPAGLQWLPTQMAACIPIPSTVLSSAEDARIGSASSELLQETLLTAWSAEQLMSGGNG
jgi:hypothetical protein